MAVRASIVIPAYNAAAYLEKAVSSALAQTEQNIEIIIVDDRSTDNTRDIASRFQVYDARVRTVFLSENHGMSYALNRAIEAAQGEWIAVLDADDWYDPSRIKKLLDAANVACVDVVVDNQVFFDGKASKKVGTAFRRDGHDEVITLNGFLRHTDPTAFFDYSRLKPVFKASFIREHTIKYREDCRRGVDYLILFDYFMAGGKGIIVDDPLYYYLQPFGSVSKQWMQPEREPYPFAHMKQFNDLYIKEYGSRLTADQLKALVRRGQGIDALARLEQLKETIIAKDPAGAIKLLLTPCMIFWKLLVKRVFVRLVSE